MTKIKDLFPNAEEDLAYVPPKRGKGRGVEKRRLIAKEALPRILNEGRGMALKEVAEIVGDRTSNNVATLLGAGCGGVKDGPNLVIINGEIVACRVNVAKLANLLSGGELEAVTAECGGREAFREMLEKLPVGR